MAHEGSGIGWAHHCVSPLGLAPKFASGEFLLCSCWPRVGCWEHRLYRFGFIIMALLAIALGLVVSTLNHQVITVDLMWTRISWPSGLLLLVAVGAGVLLGVLLSWLFSVLPLRLKIRALAHHNVKKGEHTGLTDD